MRKCFIKNSPWWWHFLVFVPASGCLCVLFRLLLDLGAGSVCLCARVEPAERPWIKEEINESGHGGSDSNLFPAPLWGLSLSTKPHSVSKHTHICIHRWGTAGRPRTQDCVSTSGRESTCLGKCKDREGEQRKVAEGKETGILSGWMSLAV